MDIVKGQHGLDRSGGGADVLRARAKELIAACARGIARQRVQIFEPAIDRRYAAMVSFSHSGLRTSLGHVSKASEILERAAAAHGVIGVDEAQFLGRRRADVCTKLANLGKRVIVAGLDTDYRGRPVRTYAAAAGDRRGNHQAAGRSAFAGQPAVQYASDWWIATMLQSAQAAPMKRVVGVLLRAVRPLPHVRRTGSADPRTAPQMSAASKLGFRDLACAGLGARASTMRIESVVSTRVDLAGAHSISGR